MNPYQTFKNAVQSTLTNKPYLGWFCTYTPVEILYAAGFEPYGIKKSSGAESEDVYLGRSLCPYIHSIFGGALEGRYNFLEGVVVAHSCECFRRLYDGWCQFSDQIKPEFCHLLDVPTVNTPLSVEYFEKSLQQLVKSLEARFNLKISKNNLQEAIGVFNQTRSLLRKLYQLRKSDPSPVSGSQMLEILDMAMTTEVRAFNQHLECFLEKLVNEQKCNPSAKSRQRLLVYGSVFNPEIVNFIEQEEIGGIVVCENACNGIRFAETTIETTTSPLKSIATGYLQKPPCPRMADDGGMDYLLDLIDQYSIDGLIYYIPKYCENLYLDYPDISAKLDQLGVPFKRLEGEIAGDINKTELKSFIEMIELKKELADFA